ncbi:MAG TPA: DUF1874 domain-containing protein [Candidatus Obscuribacterales bacterium]
MISSHYLKKKADEDGGQQLYETRVSCEVAAILPNNPLAVRSGIDMNDGTLTILNTSILTSYGAYTYEPVSLEMAKQMVRDCQGNGGVIQSAIGHRSTADLLSMLLEFPVAVNRMDFKQSVGDAALVFKLKQRAPEGAILSREQLEAIGYEFGLLVRTA